MSNELQADTDMGAFDGLRTPGVGAVPLIVTGLPDHAAVETEREVRLSQLGAIVTSVAHDLRQYIGIVRGVAELAAEGGVTLDLAGMLVRASDDINRMVQDILQFAHGVGQVTLCEVPVQALVTELEEIAFRRMEGRGIRVHRRIRSEGAVHCDRHHLVRALLNLIGNAAEAMPDGGELALTIENTRYAVVFCVQDTGGGIAPDVLPTIFERFATHGKPSGTGLGLAITRDIVRAHRGSIAVDSAVGLGSTFVITIPHPPADDRAKAAEVQQEAA